MVGRTRPIGEVGATTRRDGKTRRGPRGRRELKLPRPRPDQAEVLDAEERFKALDAGRRYGKSTLGIPAILVGHGPGWAEGSPRWIGALHGGRMWWVVPDMRKTGRDRWRDLKKATRGVYSYKNETEFRLEFPGGGSIEVRSADDPDALRGAGLDGVVIDEASLMPEVAWTEGLRPALADRKGWALFLFTPKGKTNWTWPLWLRGASEELAVAQGATDDDLATRDVLDGWAAWWRPSSANPLMDDEELAAALLEVGRLRFEQEFLAKFLVAGGTVFKTEQVRYYDREGPWLVLETDGGARRVLEKGLRRRLTADLAVSTKASADWTVLVTFAVEADTGAVIVLDVDRARLEGPDLLPRFKAAWRKWKHARMGVEKAATQLAIVQALQRAGLPVHGIAAEKDKTSRAMHLAARMEAGLVFFPRVAPWLGDLLAELLEFPEGTWDDQVDALGYAAIDAAEAPDSGFTSE